MLNYLQLLHANKALKERKKKKNNVWMNNNEIRN